MRGAGSEFVLACDMRFAARESAIFGQPEHAMGLIPGAGGIQHLTRLMGRARALEVMLSADQPELQTAWDTLRLLRTASSGNQRGKVPSGIASSSSGSISAGTT